MKFNTITSSYRVKIKDKNKIFDQTVKIYSNAVWFICNVLDDVFLSLIPLNSNERINYIEHLIHNTSKNKASYDFDNNFINFPSYLRRAAISTAIGKYSSYYSNHLNWEINKIGKEPKLSRDYLIMPCFYKDNMYKSTDNKYLIQLKLFINNSWDYVSIELNKSDVDYLSKIDLKKSNPVLEKKNNTYFIRFSIDEKYTIPTESNKVKVICAVDLGINHTAVCSILDDKGTVLKRLFISCIREEDSLNHRLNKLKKYQKLGNKENNTLWAKINNFNKNISIITSNKIINFAKENNAECIVFEYLDFTGKKRGNKKQRLHLWRKRDIQKRCEGLAHKNGMRFSRVCAFNSSALAFDGSGRVKRHEHNYSLCTFSNNKIYNCDLSASYNIGARYFIRQIEKTISEKKWLLLLAKVPEASKRSTCTLSTLKEITKTLSLI